MNSQKHLKDYIDWSEVIDRWDDERLKFKPFEFYEQWQTFIPIAKLQDSRLWDYMVAIEKIKIMEEMIQQPNYEINIGFFNSSRQ